MRGMTVFVEWEDNEIEIECHQSRQPSTGIEDWYPDIAGILNAGYKGKEAGRIWDLAYDIANED